MEARETRQMQGGAAVRISAGGEQGESCNLVPGLFYLRKRLHSSGINFILYKIKSWNNDYLRPIVALSFPFQNLEIKPSKAPETPAFWGKVSKMPDERTVIISSCNLLKIISSL